MKVLMFGWEFPPFNSGGLGTACYGMTKALSQKGVEVNFVLPKNVEITEGFLNIISANLPKTKITIVDSLLTSYMTNESYWTALRSLENRQHGYSSNLVEEVRRYAKIAGEIAAEVPHDVVHCHDWMTLLAGKEAQKVSGKPVVSHIHSTEADRSGGRGNNPRIFEIEKEGIESSNQVIAVSNFTKNKIIENYKISPSKIDVIYNGVDKKDFERDFAYNSMRKKIVLFLGRLTLHKGPDYFLRTAKRVLERNDDVIFIIAGTGDMERRIIEEACDLGIGDRVLFTGHIKDRELRKIYKMANLYVMPSVSEPFGITPLEALASGTPVLISKQSGVSEVLSHCLKVDFWDTDEMANKILAVLENQELEECLMQSGNCEIDKLNWNRAADKILAVYKSLTPMKI